MPRSTRAHKELPPSSTIPPNGYSSSPRGYDIKTEGGSRYEHGAGYAHRGGYGLSDQPGQGGSNITLPGIGALHEQLRQDNEPRAKSRHTAGRVPENHNPHRRDFAALPHRTPHGGQASRKEHTSNRSPDHICIERESLALHSSHLSNPSGSRSIDARAKRDTQGSRNRFWHSDEDSDLIDYARDGYNWTEIAVRMGRTEDSVRGHWYYGNLNSDPRAQGVSYRPLHRNGASLGPAPLP